MSKQITLAEINDLEADDIDGAFDKLDEYGLDADGINDVKDIQDKLRHLYIQQTEQTGGGTPKTTKQILKLPDIIKANEETRAKLWEGIACGEMWLDEIPDKHRQGVDTIFPQVKNTLQQHLRELDVVNPVILIAGETSAGKSSLLNLLLGDLADDILPTSHLSSTSVITELKYGDRKHMIAHAMTDDVQPERVDLDGEDVASQLSKFIHQKGDRSSQFPYKMVEIYWPCEWLRGGVTIVDSPGVGEDDDLTHMVKQYMPRASGFVYVINTPNAGGINPDRLQDLMLSHLQGSDSGDFMPSTAMFICNKWDQVPQAEKELVKETVFSKLDNIWSGFKHEQVYFVSVKQIVDELKQSVTSDTYIDMLRGFEKLIPISYKSKLSTYYRFSKKVLERTMYEMKSFIKCSTNDDSKKTKLREAQDKLNTMKGRSQEIETSLELILNQEISCINQELKIHLQSAQTKSNLCNWTKQECPRWEDDVARLDQKKKAYAYKRVRSIINKWDTENKKYETLYGKMLRTAKVYSENIETCLKEIEDQVSTEKEWFEDFTFVENVLHTPIDIDASYDGTYQGGGVDAVWVPLGMAVNLIARPIRQYLRERQKNQLKKQYEENCEEQMYQETLNVIEYLMDNNQLEKLIDQRYERLTTTFQRLFANIPKIIEADEILINDLTRTLEMAEENRLKCNESMQKGEVLLGNLDEIYITRLADFSRDIEKYRDWTYIGEGVYARVFKALTQQNGKETAVAIKSLKEPVNKENATDFLAEMYNLRNLKGSNVVGYYDTLINEIQGNIFPIFVMEYCSTTLDTIIYADDYSSPAFCPDADLDMVIINANKMAMEMASGLAAIHRKNFLHRDLKPENILVSSEGVIKIADLGLAKDLSNITGTLVGTPLYMAPEVWEENKYTEKADMFGFALVMWEIWHGADVNVKFQCNSIVKIPEALKSFVQDPFMNMQNYREPIESWKNVMVPCWNLKPEKRLSAAKCLELLGKT